MEVQREESWCGEKQEYRKGQYHSESQYHSEGQRQRQRQSQDKKIAKIDDQNLQKRRRIFLNREMELATSDSLNQKKVVRIIIRRFPLMNDMFVQMMTTLIYRTQNKQKSEGFCNCCIFRKFECSLKSCFEGFILLDCFIHCEQLAEFMMLFGQPIKPFEKLDPSLLNFHFFESLQLVSFVLLTLYQNSDVICRYVIKDSIPNSLVSYFLTVALFQPNIFIKYQYLSTYVKILFENRPQCRDHFLEHICQINEIETIIVNFCRIRSPELPDILIKMLFGTKKNNLPSDYVISRALFPLINELTQSLAAGFEKFQLYTVINHIVKFKAEIVLDILYYFIVLQKKLTIEAYKIFCICDVQYWYSWWQKDRMKELQEEQNEYRVRMGPYYNNISQDVPESKKHDLLQRKWVYDQKLFLLKKTIEQQVSFYMQNGHRRNNS